MNKVLGGETAAGFVLIDRRERLNQWAVIQWLDQTMVVSMPLLDHNRLSNGIVLDCVGVISLSFTLTVLILHGLSNISYLKFSHLLFILERWKSTPVPRCTIMINDKWRHIWVEDCGDK